MAAPEGTIRCPAYKSARGGVDSIPVCGETYMSGGAMRESCPEYIKGATTESCFVVPTRAHLIPRGFLLNWRTILQQRAEDESKRLG